MVGSITGLALGLVPYLPTIAKAVMGWLPPNATATVMKVVDVAKQGLAISQPIVRVLDTIAGNSALVDGPGQASPDISLAEMHASLAELDRPGVYEDALAKAKAQLGQQPSQQPGQAAARP